MTKPDMGAGRTARAAALPRSILLLALVALASTRGYAASQQDEDACRPEVFRLCTSAIPNEEAIVACLNAHLTDLAAACRAVIDPTPRSAATLRRRRPAVP